MRKMIFAAVMAVVGSVFALTAQAVPNYVMPIEVTGCTASSPLKDFPVLVRLPATFDYAACAEGGADLSFALADGTVLAYEIDTWNTEGESLVWVKIPSLSNGVKFFCRYGDSTAVSPTAAEAAKTWSAFAGVWHLDEDGDVSKDSGANGLDAANKKTVGLIPGKLGGAHLISNNAKKGTDGAIVIPEYDALKLGDAFAVSMWTTNCFASGNNSAHNGDMIVARRSYNDWSSEAGGFYVNVSGNATKSIVCAGNVNNTLTGTSPIDPATEWIHLSICYTTSYASIYVNGALVKNGSIKYNIRDNGMPLVLGNNGLAAETGTGGVSWKGAFDEFRLCGMQDNADWFKAEYDTVAKSDFLTLGAAVANGLTIAATGGEYGSPNPAYGCHDVSGEVTCTADATVAVDATTQRALKGWTLIHADGTSASGTGNSTTFTVQPGDQLVWNYGDQYKLTVNAVGNGSTKYTGAWFDAGAEYTLEPVPGEGAGFWKWSGDDVPDTWALSENLKLTIDGPKTITAHFGGVKYVSPTGDNSDGSSWATAYTHPQTAIEAASEGDTILVADGTYGLESGSSVVSLTKNVVVKSQNGYANCILDAGGLDSANQRALLIAAAATESRVSGFCFKNGSDTSYGQNTPVESHAGVIENCITYGRRNNRTRVVGLFDTAIMRNSIVDGTGIYNWNPDGQPAGVYMEGKSILDGCEVRNFGEKGRMPAIRMNSTKSTTPILENNPIVRNCFVHDNIGDYRLSTPGLYVTGYGTVENCTIVKNTANGKCGGAYIQGSNTSVAMTDAQFRFVNNILWNNTGTERNDLSGSAASNYGQGNAMYCCASDVYAGNIRGNISHDPMFADSENGDYRLIACSPCMTRGENGSRMGAFGSVAAKTPTIAESVKKANVMTPNTFDFSVATSGFSGDVVCTWNFGDGTTATGTSVRHSYASEVGATYDVTLTVTPTTGDPVVKTLTAAAYAAGATAYVAEDGGNVAPYDTWAKAATSLEDAFNVGTTQIVIRAGTYEVVSETIVERALTICSESGNPEDVTIWGNGKASSVSLRIFTLNHPQAVLSGLTITKGYLNGNTLFGAAVRIAAPQPSTLYTHDGYNGYGGMVTNCVIKDNYACSKSCRSAGIFARGPKAVITHTKFFDNATSRQTDTGAWGGSALALESGALGRDLLITGTTAVSDRLASPVFLDKGSTLLNATVANNDMKSGTYSVGGVHVMDGKSTVQNCVIYGNTTTAGVSAYKTWAVGTTWSTDAKTIAAEAAYSNRYVNCAMDEYAPNPACHAGADLNLTDPANRDYHPLAGSACIDKGADHALLSSKDLDGNKRVQGKGVDIGCYEFDSSAFSVGFVANTDKAFAPATITLTPVLNGVSDDDDVKCYWDVTGDGKTDYITIGTNALEVVLKSAYYTVTLTASNDTTKASGAVTVPNVVKVGAKTMYVKKDNAGAAYPFDSEANAAADIQSAIDEALPGATVLVLPGVYTMPSASPVLVDREITLCSATGNRDDVVIRGTDVGNGGPCIKINAGANALIHTMIFEHGLNSYNTSAPVYLTAKGGCVSNCVMRNSTADGKFGVGVVYSDTANGFVTHCIITNNIGNCGYNDGASIVGIAADMRGGRIEHSLIAYNRTGMGTWADNSGIGQVTVNLKNSAKARFLTVVSNSVWNVAGINLQDNSSFEYCVIAGNHSSHMDPLIVGAQNEWSDLFTTNIWNRWHVWGSLTEVGSSKGRKGNDDVTVAKEIANATEAFIADRAVLSLGDTVKINDSCITGDVKTIFRDYAHSNFRIPYGTAISELVAPADLDEAGVAMPAKDVFGKPRLRGEKYDLGAIECQLVDGVMLLLR